MNLHSFNSTLKLYAEAFAPLALMLFFEGVLLWLVKREMYVLVNLSLGVRIVIVLGIVFIFNIFAEQRSLRQIKKHDTDLWSRIYTPYKMPGWFRTAFVLEQLQNNDRWSNTLKIKIKIWTVSIVVLMATAPLFILLWSYFAYCARM